MRRINYESINKKGLIITALGIAAIGVRLNQTIDVKADAENNSVIENVQSGEKLKQDGQNIHSQSTPIAQENKQSVTTVDQSKTNQESDLNDTKQSSVDSDSAKEKDVLKSNDDASPKTNNDDIQPESPQFPAVTDTTEEGVTDGQEETSPIRTTVQISATNDSGTAISNSKVTDVMVDANAKDVNAIFTVVNTSGDDQDTTFSRFPGSRENLGEILCLPKYYKETTPENDVEVSNDLSVDELTKNLPENAYLKYSTTDFFGMKTYDELIKDNPDFKWSDLSEIGIYFDGTPMKGGSSFSISVPLVAGKSINIYDATAGKFSIGAVSSKFTGAYRRYVRFGKTSGIKLATGDKPYEAIWVNPVNQDYEDVPDEIQELMPVAKSDAMEIDNFWTYEFATDQTLVYTGSIVAVDLEYVGIPEIVKDKGYSVLLTDADSEGKRYPQEFYTFSANDDESERSDSSDDEDYVETNPFVYIILRKVIDTKDLSLKVGDNWSNTDNFVSGLDNDDKPLSAKDVQVSVDDPDVILKDGKVTKEGKLTVRYSYKISDSFYENDAPYIITKTASVNVEKVPTTNGSNVADHIQDNGNATHTHAHVTHQTHQTNTSHSHKTMHKNNGETVSTSSHETTANVDNTSIKHVQRILATNPDNTETVLYNIEGQKVGNRALGKNTSWYSDQELTLDEKLYYRVSTNEWVDSNDVYSYESKNIVVKTQALAQLLYTANGKKITNRELAPNTAWKADRLAYINGKSYYRVATNEFVPVSDMIVK